MKQNKASYWAFLPIRWKQPWKHVQLLNSLIWEPEGLWSPTIYLFLSCMYSTIYFSFMNNETLKQHTLPLIMFVLQKRRKSPWNKSLWFSHELTKCHFLPTAGPFSLWKKCLGFGDFSFAFFPVFHFLPVLEIWDVAVQGTSCLWLSFSPTPLSLSNFAAG